MKEYEQLIHQTAAELKSFGDQVKQLRSDVGSLTARQTDFLEKMASHATLVEMLKSGFSGLIEKVPAIELRLTQLEREVQSKTQLQAVTIQSRTKLLAAVFAVVVPAIVTLLTLTLSQ